MNPRGNTILITGGSSGIGLALARRFLESNNEVIVTGRRAEALESVRQQLPGIHTIVSDAGHAQQRAELAQRVIRDFPRLNVLINNAGIQRPVDLGATADWTQIATEIDVNLAGPIHLALLLTPHLRQQASPRIINVSSALAFAPLARVPVYCATKAALHSFSQSLRQQLRNTSIQVIEVIPPAVKTNLGGAHNFGEELDPFADAVLKQILEDAPEIGFGPSTHLLRASRDQLDQAFERMNRGVARGAGAS